MTDSALTGREWSDPLDVERFDAAQEACAEIHASPDQDTLALTIEQQTRRLLSCDDAAVLLRHGTGAGQRLTDGRPTRRARNYPLSKGIVGRVARDLVDYICNDPASDEHYIEVIDGIDGAGARNLAVTAMSAPDQEIGVIPNGREAIGDRATGDR